jgi:hypothetical protein
MKKVIFALLVACFSLAITNLASAIDTSVEPAKRADLTTEFGQWLYSMPYTDLDLCIAHQSDAVATEADSQEVYNTIAKKVIFRRVAWLQRQTTAKQAGTVLSDSAKIALRMRFCKDELLALKDTCDLMGAAGIPVSQIQTYKKSIWAKMDTTVQAQMAIQAGNANIDDLAAKLEARGYYFGSSTINPDDFVTRDEWTSRNDTVSDSMLIIINGFEAKFAEVDDKFEEVESRISNVENRLADHMATPIKRAHPGK